jgi:ABC-type dipeptide/oligopeptide/nickel transport system permease subunit
MNELPASRMEDDRRPLSASGWIAPLIVLGYLTAAAGVWLGLWANDWGEITGTMWAAPSADHWLGTNRLGQDIFSRAVAATATAFEIGLLVALASSVIGGLLGALSGHYSGSRLDELILWLKGTIDAIPFYLLVVAIAFALRGHAMAMHLAMIVAFWTTTARIVRAETMRIGKAGFIEAARAGGSTPTRIIVRHLLPNLVHVLLVQATLVFVAAIKAEVILSFLGIGVQDSISWGLMLAEAGQDIMAGQHMNFLAASLGLFGLVMAGSLLADRMQDQLDPRTRQWRTAAIGQRQR